MIIFDTLDNLESYQGISDKIMRVITVMDRALPYEESAGKHKCPEDDEVLYEIRDYSTTDKGQIEIPHEKEYSLEIVLEGEAITSVKGEDVFVMAPGRFLLIKGEESIRRAQTRNIEKSVRSVIFRF